MHSISVSPAAPPPAVVASPPSVPRRRRSKRRDLDVKQYLTATATGSPVTTEQLARAIGVATVTIREDIRYGALKAFKAGAQRRAGKKVRREWRIEFLEAKRYLQEMGVLEKLHPLVARKTN